MSSPWNTPIPVITDGWNTPIPVITDGPLVWAELLPEPGESYLAEVRLSQLAYDLLCEFCPTGPAGDFDTMWGIPVVRDDLFSPGWWELRDQHGQVMRSGFLATPGALINLVVSLRSR